MSFTINQVVGGNNGGAGGSATAAVTVPSGHSLGVWILFNSFGNGGAIGLVSDPSGNTYAAPTTAVSVNGLGMGASYAIAITSPIVSVSVSVSGGSGSNYLEFAVWDLTVSGTPSFADSKALFMTGVTATDGITSGSLSGITSTDAIIMGGASDFSSNTLTAGTGFTLDYTSPFGTNARAEHRAVTSAAALTLTDAGAGGTVGVATVALQVAGGVTGFTLTAAAGSYSMTGESVAAILSYSLTASTGSYVITGEAITNALAFAAAAGSYVMTGKAITNGLSFAAASGVYAITGEAVTNGFGFSAAFGAYTLTGESANLVPVQGFVLPAAFGSYTMTGETAALTGVFILNAGFGNYAITSVGANLTFSGSGVKATQRASRRGMYTLLGRHGRKY